MFCIYLKCWNRFSKVSWHVIEVGQLWVTCAALSSIKPENWTCKHNVLSVIILLEYCMCTPTLSCACHPCTKVVPIFFVLFQIYRMSLRDIRLRCFVCLEQKTPTDVFCLLEHKCSTNCSIIVLGCEVLILQQNCTQNLVSFTYVKASLQAFIIYLNVCFCRTVSVGRWSSYFITENHLFHLPRK